MQARDKGGGPGCRSRFFERGNLHTYMLIKALRNEDLVIGLKHDVVLGVSLLDDALKIDNEVFAIFPRHLDLALIGESPKPPARMTALLTV